LNVWRNGKTIKVAVTTGELPSDLTKVANSAPPKKEADPETYGLQLQNVTKELADKLKLKSAAGALVTDVTPGSAASDSDVQREDVIQEIDRKPVADAAAANKLLRDHDPKKDPLLFIDRKGQKTYTVLKTGK
jgi:S1-C subfamily serine protease